MVGEAQTEAGCTPGAVLIRIAQFESTRPRIDQFSLSGKDHDHAGREVQALGNPHANVRGAQQFAVSAVALVCIVLRL